MGAAPRKHTQEYKDEAAQLVFESDWPLAGVASRDIPNTVTNRHRLRARLPSAIKLKVMALFPPPPRDARTPIPPLDPHRYCRSLSCEPEPAGQRPGRVH